MAGSATGNETSGLLGAFHDRKILEVLENNTVYYQLADKRPITERNGNVITFHTITKLENGHNIKPFIGTLHLINLVNKKFRPE